MPYKACSFSLFLCNSCDNSTGEIHGWDSDMRRLDKDGLFHLCNVYSVVNRTTALIFTQKRFIWTAVARETRRQIILCYCDCFVKKKSASLLANFSVKLSDLISTECTTHAAQSTHVSVFLRKPVAKKHETQRWKRVCVCTCESVCMRATCSLISLYYVMVVQCGWWGAGRGFLMLFIWDHNSVSAASLGVRVCKIAPLLFSKVIYV